MSGKKSGSSEHLKIMVKCMEKIRVMRIKSIFVGHFALLDKDPDPATQINADPCESKYKIP
jgi:hypothetical protein